MVAPAPTSRSALAGRARPLPRSRPQPRAAAAAAAPHRPLRAPPLHASASILPRLRGACARAGRAASTSVKAAARMMVVRRVFTAGRRRRGRCTCVARASRPCRVRVQPLSARICGASRSLWSSSLAKRRTKTNKDIVGFGWAFVLSRLFQRRTTRRLRQRQSINFSTFFFSFGTL